MIAGAATNVLWLSPMELVGALAAVAVLILIVLMLIGSRHWLVPVLAVIVLLLTCIGSRADYYSDNPPVFGQLSKRYLDRKRLKDWREACKGGGRYDAMREAYEAGKPDPCNGAKKWVR